MPSSAKPPRARRSGSMFSCARPFWTPDPIVTARIAATRSTCLAPVAPGRCGRGLPLFHFAVRITFPPLRGTTVVLVVFSDIQSLNAITGRSGMFYPCGWLADWVLHIMKQCSQVIDGHRRVGAWVQLGPRRFVVHHSQSSYDRAGITEKKKIKKTHSKRSQESGIFKNSL